MAKKNITTKPIEAVEEKPIEVIEEKPVKKTYIGTAKVTVNVRKESTLTSDIVKVLQKDDSIKVLNTFENDGFVKVYGGYIKAEYLDIKEA